MERSPSGLRGRGARSTAKAAAIATQALSSFHPELKMAFESARKRLIPRFRIVCQTSPRPIWTRADINST
ncbi:MAG: hypothetical protein WBQ55_21160, partial [Xanthobacteraceae bacterium]